ncbi:caspase family protein [Actinacidiphila acididurans]|uniref:Caspase family protein n=1 Tax=Actinacidiphila acididurans TaxID=2784346 RepID=A0ABS2TX63_9ACTN|nr:caspase family protein [Actinacidiphila acididurans]MBM9507932.1 caspase family protein [Actinacidiphila acididurans]
MTDWLVPDLSNSYAVLVGTAQYDEFPQIPAAANSLDRMFRLLTGELCTWPTQRVTVVRDAHEPGSLPDRLVELYEQAKDVALFYFVGHGLLDDEDALCLGLRGTRENLFRRATTALSYNAVRRALRASPARTKIVILDCCFAGKAAHGHQTLNGPVQEVAGLVHGTGAYTLAATSPYGSAWFESEGESDAVQTYFTKYLVDTVERGVPGGPVGLTIESIFLRLVEELTAAGRPSPTRLSLDLADTFVFALNAANQAKASPEWKAGWIETIARAREIAWALFVVLTQVLGGTFTAASLGRVGSRLEADGNDTGTGGILDRTRRGVRRRIGDAMGARAGEVRSKRDSGLDRARSLADDLDDALVVARANAADHDTARAADRVRAVAHALTGFLHNPGLTQVTEVMRTSARDVTTALNQVPMDATETDLSGLAEAGFTDVRAFAGTKWSEGTIWPPGLEEKIRQSSDTLEPGVYQVRET